MAPSLRQSVQLLSTALQSLPVLQVQIVVFRDPLSAVEKTPAAAGNHSCAVTVPWAGRRGDNGEKQHDAELHNKLALNWYGFLSGFKGSIKKCH